MSFGLIYNVFLYTSVGKTNKCLKDSKTWLRFVEEN